MFGLTITLKLDCGVTDKNASAFYQILNKKKIVNILDTFKKNEVTIIVSRWTRWVINRNVHVIGWGLDLKMGHK